MEAASTCSLTQANQVVSQLKAGLAEAKRVNRQVTPVSDIDNFKRLMSKFLSRASDEVEALEDLFEKTEKKYTELATFYAEDPAKLPAEEFFKTIATFINQVRDGYKMLSNVQKAEEAKARIEAKRAERLAEMSEGGREEEVAAAAPTASGKKPSKTPRVGRGAAQDAVAGIDLDALIAGGGSKASEEPKKKATSRRKVDKGEAAAALAGIDLDKMLGK